MFREVEVAIAPHLSQVRDDVRKRWFALRSALARGEEQYADAGITDNSIALTMDLFKVAIGTLGKEGPAMDIDEPPVAKAPVVLKARDEGAGFESEATPILRRSSRSSRKAGKARAVDEESEDDEEDEGDDDDDDEEDGEEGENGGSEEEGEGDDADGEEDGEVAIVAETLEVVKAEAVLVEKEHWNYMPFEANTHFMWEKRVRSDFTIFFSFSFGLQCTFCVRGSFLCFGDVFLKTGRLSSKTKCQSCAIIRKPCVGGVRKASPRGSPGTIVVKAPPGSQASAAAIKVPPRPKPKASAGSLSQFVQGSAMDVDFETVYLLAGTPLGRVAPPPLIDLKGRMLTKKRLAVAPPTATAPSSSKVLRSSQSSSAIIPSAITRTSSGKSSASIPSPLAYTPPFPPPVSLAPQVLPAQMTLDPPEDQMLLLLDALEFAIDRGNLDDVRKRIQALRKLQRMEEGHSG